MLVWVRSRRLALVCGGEWELEFNLDDDVRVWASASLLLLP